VIFNDKWARTYLSLKITCGKDLQPVEITGV